MTGEDKTEAEAATSDRTVPATSDPADVNARADAIDEATDGDGVARFHAAGRDSSAV